MRRRCSPCIATSACKRHISGEITSNLHQHAQRRRVPAQRWAARWVTEPAHLQDWSRTANANAASSHRLAQWCTKLGTCSCTHWLSCPIGSPPQRSRMSMHALPTRLLGLRNPTALMILCNRNFSAAASTAQPTYNVPAGHQSSDLRSTACHIGLGRRRDLLMRQDLALWKGDTKLSLADVFKGVRALLVGFPGGAVCTEQHIPGYCQAASQLKEMGIDKVVCVTMQDPKQLTEWAAKKGFGAAPLIEVLADHNGGFMRLLGMDLVGEPLGDKGIPCQRFAAVVDNGILLRLKVEDQPAELKVSDVKSMMKTYSETYA